MNRLLYLIGLISFSVFSQQYARPISDVTVTSITGTYADIDETTPNDSDYVSSADNTAATYETLLSSVTDSEVHTGHTIRIRYAKADTNVAPSTDGNSISMSLYLYQGATLISELETDISLGGWVTSTYTITEGEALTITDYTDLRIRMTCTTSGGSPTNRRGSAISWVEVETPDYVPPTNFIPEITLTGDTVINILNGDAYTELGATATDFEDGDITGSLVITGDVITGTNGTYYKYYNVTDSDLNPADEVIRTIIVQPINRKIKGKANLIGINGGVIKIKIN